MIDRLVLQALKTRKRFQLLSTAVPREMLDPLTGQLLDWYAVYFKAYPEHDVINIEALGTTIKLRSGMGADDFAMVTEILDYLAQEVPEEILSQTLAQLESLAFVGKAQAFISQYHANAEIDIVYEIKNLVEQTSGRLAMSQVDTWEEPSLDDLLALTDDDTGIKLRALPELAARINSLHPGHNVAIVAPTNKGKTALMCKLAGDFAEQARTLYPNQPILYLVNEGLANLIRIRVLEAVLGLNRNQVKEYQQQGVLEQMYLAKVGRKDAIRAINIHGMSDLEVFRIIDRHKPWCVFTDMTGRIKPHKSTGNESKDLEEVWNGFREQAARQGFLHVGSVQISADGFDELYPSLDQMQWSRVGIQTTLDLAIVMGALKDPIQEQLRGISTPKNKLAKVGCSDNTRLKYFFDKDTNSWDHVKV